MGPFQLPPPLSPAPDNSGAPLAPPPGPGGMNGIPGAMGMPAPPFPMPPGPSDMKYTNETQQDGSVLLRLLNPDGSPGPVVKIIPAPMGGGKKKT